MLGKDLVYAGGLYSVLEQGDEEPLLWYINQKYIDNNEKLKSVDGLLTGNNEMIGEMISKMFESKYRNIVWYCDNLGNFYSFLTSIYKTVLAIMKLHHSIKSIQFLTLAIRRLKNQLLILILVTYILSTLNRLFFSFFF